MKNIDKITFLFAQKLKEKQINLFELEQKKQQLTSMHGDLNKQVLAEQNNILSFPELMYFNINYIYNVQNRIANVNQELINLDLKIANAAEELADAFMEDKKMHIYITNRNAVEKKIKLNKANKKSDELTIIRENYS